MKKGEISIIKELGLRSKKVKRSYIAECEVLDTETNEKCYVVTSLGDLYYGTFKSSYLDYALGKVQDRPQEIEGGGSMWLDIFEDRNQSKFWAQYGKTFDEASGLGHKDYINRKYSHLKKPLGNMPYKIINKNSDCEFACGPVGDFYEIEFLVLADNSHLFVNSDDISGCYSITDYSTFELMQNEETSKSIVYKEPIETISDFSKAKKSKYYDFYLEMEKLRDNYQEEK